MTNTKTHAGLIGPVDSHRQERLLNLYDLLNSNKKQVLDLRWPDHHQLERGALNDLQFEGHKTVIPLARSLADHSQLIRSGVPLISEPQFRDLCLPTLDRSLEAGWGGTSPDIGDEGITASFPKPKRLSAFIVVSDQIKLQSPVLAGAWLELQLLSAIGRALDKAAIVGTGTNDQPTGVFVDSGVLTHTRAVSNTDSLSDLASMEKAVADANGEYDGDDYVWICDTATRKELRTQPSFTGSGDVYGDPLWRSNRGSGPLGFPGIASVHAPANSLALAQTSAMTFVDWNRLKIENLTNIDQATAGFRYMVVTGYYHFTITDPNGICKAVNPA